MSKSHLILAMAEGANISKNQATLALNCFIDKIKKSVKNGESVSLIGFGTFSRVEQKARSGVNPSTMEKIHIKAKMAPKFKISKSFKDLVAGK